VEHGQGRRLAVLAAGTIVGALLRGLRGEGGEEAMSNGIKISHATPWSVRGDTFGYLVTDRNGLIVQPQEIVEVTNAMQREFEILYAENGELKAKLRQAVEAIQALTDPEGHIYHGSCCTGECRDCRAVLAENADIVAKIEAERDSRTDLCRGMEEHAKKGGEQ